MTDMSPRAQTEELIEKHARVAALQVHRQGLREDQMSGSELNALTNTRHILSRFAEALSASPGSPWRPIAEVSQDIKDASTVVIGYDPNRDDDDGLPHGVDFMRWLDGRWIDPLTHTLTPTHWMPLPSPPE